MMRFIVPKGRTVVRSSVFVALGILLATTDCIADMPTASQIGAAAQQIVVRSKAAGGVCAIVGNPRIELAEAIAKQGPFTVHCLASDTSQLASLRRAIRSRDMADTISADTLRGNLLPYTDNLINVLVVEFGANLTTETISPGEYVRTIAPLGSLYIHTPNQRAVTEAFATAGVTLAPMQSDASWLFWQKPWPTDIDQWTHYLHGADGNPVAQDRVVAPPVHYQWTAGPKWLRSHESDSSVSTLVTARGRLFYIIDEAPASLLGPQSPSGQWYLESRDAFNGVLLWKVPIRRWGWREWKTTWFAMRPGDYPLSLRKTLVAVDDRVYVTLGFKAPVSELDARTGEILQTYEQTAGTTELLVQDGKVIVAALQEDGPHVMAINAADGKTLWRTEQTYAGTTVDYLRWSRLGDSSPPEQIDPALNIATDGKIIALIDGKHLVGLNMTTGKKQWQADFPLTEQDQRAGNIAAKDGLWNGLMIVTQGVVLHASPYQLAAFSSATGKLLWQQPKAYIGHLWYEWKDVFVIDGLVWTWSAELEQGSFGVSGNRKQRELWPSSANGYDLHTGKLNKTVATGPIFMTHHHHRCYRDKATSRYILASRRGTEYVDLTGGPHSVNNWVRGTCHVGMMPANGLQYAPPHPCVCYDQEKLTGMNALAPARADDADPARRVPLDQRLQHGPAWDQAAADAKNESLQGQWPTFRHDVARSGAVDTRLANNLTQSWRTKVGSRVSPPIVVGDRVYVSAMDQHDIVCLSARDGTTQWSFATGARVDSPPTYFQNTVLFGSADGWVYCLRASDGQLVWKFMAAPEQRWIGVSSQLESPWPVHGSLLVLDGIVYFAAGRSSELDGGIFMYALDASNGRLVHQRQLQGPAYTSEDIETNFQLPMGALTDVMMSDGDNIYMRSLAFDLQLNRRKGKPNLEIRSGLLDDSYFKRTPWRFDREYARLLVHDNRSVYYVRMFDSLKGLDPRVYFTPTAQGYLLFAKNLNGRNDTWRTRVRVRIRAMLLAGNQLVAAGPPDEIDAKDPWGAFEGRKGGRMFIVDTSSGKDQQEYQLTSPPVFNGIAAANNRIYLVDQDGSVVCFE